MWESLGKLTYFRNENLLPNAEWRGVEWPGSLDEVCERIGETFRVEVTLIGHVDVISESFETSLSKIYK